MNLIYKNCQNLRHIWRCMRVFIFLNLSHHQIIKKNEKITKSLLKHFIIFSGMHSYKLSLKITTSTDNHLIDQLEIIRLSPFSETKIEKTVNQQARAHAMKDRLKDLFTN
ncbi:hypothetical protein BpHYR1_022168 [Brachionus plicatilis]|uniref:Uncharacterized protein n=1 Tax=Brachionus plicatilis TaxID=10195 RepID=A0A3M7QKY3_BRAPC|nr:hypothetical protein BpHYR1_022168 [Brachionus plicatilis]